MSIQNLMPIVDAQTFQTPLMKVTEAVAQMEKRTGAKYMATPQFVSEDIFIIMRHCMRAYDFLFYVNADEHRKECEWTPSLGVIAAPAVRTMIDGLYNVTAILQNPSVNGLWYRRSGLKKTLQNIEADKARYGGSPEWDEYLDHRKQDLEKLVRLCNFTNAEVRKTKPWPTLGRYIQEMPSTPHREFLERFTHLQWRQYSALSHAAFESYISEDRIYTYLAADTLPHDWRPKVNAQYESLLSLTLGRAAILLLCLATEVKAYFRFSVADGTDVNDRLVEMWDKLSGFFEAKEIFDARYYALLGGRSVS